MNDLYNEFERAIFIYENDIKFIRTRDLILFGKYLRQYKGMGQKTIRKEIIKKCISSDDTFNPIVKRSTLDFVVRSSMNDTPLTNVSKINIYQEEIEKIKEIKNFKKQCLLLSMLIIVKIKKNKSNRFFINYKDIPLAIKLSKCGFARKFFDDVMIKEYGESGKTIYNQRYDTFELLFADGAGDIAFDFKIGDDIKSLYIEYLGGEIAYCRKCDKEFIKKSNRKEDCDDCYREYRKEIIRDSTRKWRVNS